MYGEGKIFCTGLTRAATAGLKSFVPVIFCETRRFEIFTTSNIVNESYETRPSLCLSLHYCLQQNLVSSMYFFENGRFVIFTSVDVLKPDVLQPNVLKT